MLLTVTHTTAYIYDAPVTYALQRMHLTPQNSPQQRVVDWDLAVKGGHRQVRYVDHYGNLSDLISMDSDATSLTVTAKGQVETTDTFGILGHVPSSVPLWHYRRQTPLTEPGDAVRALAEGFDGSGNALNALHALSDRLGEAVRYVPGATYSGTSAEEAAKGGAGVCQDQAQIFLSVARMAGIPARYVSGYLMMPDQIDQDASHAWAEAWLPDLGWVGFDVTNGQSPDDRYVRIAAASDYASAAPVSGMRMGEAVESLVVSLQVQQ